MNVNRIGRLVGAIALLCSCAFGQSITGTLQGIVQDPAGAVVPDAKVVIKSVDTGVTRNAVTGNDGLFIFNAVDPATYNLTITAKAGFKVYEEQNIVLTANERRDLGKIALSHRIADRDSFGHRYQHAHTDVFRRKLEADRGRAVGQHHH